MLPECTLDGGRRLADLCQIPQLLQHLSLLPTVCCLLAEDLALLPQYALSESPFAFDHQLTDNLLVYRLDRPHLHPRALHRLQDHVPVTPPHVF